MSQSFQIEFHSEDISFQVSDPEKYRSWLRGVIQSEQKSLIHLNYIFCSDNYLLDVNRKHLGHDFYTDVITFPLSKENIEGDVFISIDRVKENAAHFDVPFHHELSRVMVHGVLHLIGYDDSNKDEQGLMRSLEEKYLKLLF